jgi:hypothetical protein
MPAHGVGPPEKERPGGYQAARPDQQISNDTTNTDHDSRSDRQAAHDAHRGKHVETCEWCRGDRPRQVEHVSDQLRRRRLAAHRLPPLEHSGRRDPWSRVTG